MKMIVGHSKFIPERICGDINGRVAVFILQNYNFTKSNAIMLFSWEFSKLLESIIFRNIFNCVEKLNYIKNFKNKRDLPKVEVYFSFYDQLDSRRWEIRLKWMQGVLKSGLHRMAFRLTMRDRVGASGREI